MATTFRGSLCHGNWNWCQKRYCPYLLRRNGTSSYSWGFGHVLAVVGGCRYVNHFWSSAPVLIIFRYLLRFLRQCHCQGHWSHRVATPTGLRLHPLLHSCRWYLVLPRISSLAYEEGQPRQSFPVHDSPACPPHHRCKRLLLFLCDFRRREGCGRWFRIFHAHVGLLCCP